MDWSYLVEELPSKTRYRRKGRRKDTQVKEKGVTRCMQLLDDLKETKGYKKLNQEAQDHNLWITCFGRGYGPVTRHTTE
jgi:hypothetical protein